MINLGFGGRQRVAHFEQMTAHPHRRHVPFKFKSPARHLVFELLQIELKASLFPPTGQVAGPE